MAISSTFLFFVLFNRFLYKQENLLQIFKRQLISKNLKYGHAHVPRPQQNCAKKMATKESSLLNLLASSRNIRVKISQPNYIVADENSFVVIRL